jgi:branched-chain amino acid transport system permease protein
LRRLALSVSLALLATVPLWVANSYYVNIASQILLYAVFALGLNVLVGYAGLVSLGHAGLFGIAAYAGAIFINGGTDHFIAVIGALAATLLAAAVFAVLALRGTGLGFVMITVALGQIVWGVACRWQPHRAFIGRRSSCSWPPSRRSRFLSARHSAPACAAPATSRVG